MEREQVGRVTNSAAGCLLFFFLFSFFPANLFLDKQENSTITVHCVAQPMSFWTSQLTIMTVQQKGRNISEEASRREKEIKFH